MPPTRRYTVLTTFPGERSSANVGDQLIEIAVKRLIEHELGAVEYLTIFREDPLDDVLDEVNATQAILLPGFGVRAAVPMHPGVYRLVENLDRLKVPMVPIGANWNVYPGDAVSRDTLRLPAENVAFVKRIAAGVTLLSCREYHLLEVLRRHGIMNAIMTGDPAWYDPGFFGKPLHRPTRINKIVFSPPLSAFYGSQAVDLLTMLAELFPSAERYCAFHLTDLIASEFDDRSATNDSSMRPDVARKNALIRSHASELGYEILELAGHVEKLDFYRECDLHIGYECHAHLGFFRQRRPSVLIAEDARGVGFNYTLGIGGFDGFQRVNNSSSLLPAEGGTSGYCVTQEEFDIAPARSDLASAVRRFVTEELDTGFRRYLGVADLIDETYEKTMRPYLRGLPT